MKKRLFLLLALAILIVCNFVGCRNQAAESGVASGAPSGVVSSIESAGGTIVSQASGVISGVVSGGQELLSQAPGTTSSMMSSY